MRPRRTARHADLLPVLARRGKEPTTSTTTTITTTTRSGSGLVAFLGPSLSAAEARRIAPGCTLLPPAAQGDVWRALALRPRALAIVDGVFESRPSVWHHEILDALDAGVAVFGAASMGALRAAELHGHGMVGIGAVFRGYRDGALRGDDEVALLHAGAEHGWRGLTVPLVNVRHAAALALRERVVSSREERAIVGAASALFYQERTWPAVFEAARLTAAARARWDAFFARGLPDPKADDARECLRAADALVRAGAAAPGVAFPTRPRSSLVRRRSTLDGATRVRRSAVANREIVAALRARSGARRLADSGLRTLALAAVARSLGIAVSAAEAAAARDRWLAELGVPARARDAFLGASGLDAGEAARLFETLALERRVLDAAAHLLPDGPSPEEGLALAARIDGTWARAAQAIAERRRSSGEV